MKPQTIWANKNSPFTNKVPIREVPVPRVAMPRKGRTKYDDDFIKLLDFNSAIESTEDGFEILRRALQRYVVNQGIKEKVRIRRQTDRKTRLVTMWLELREESSND